LLGFIWFAWEEFAPWLNPASRRPRIEARDVVASIDAVRAFARREPLNPTPCRTIRRTSVTEVGERFYEHCLAILGHIDSASMEIGAEKQIVGHLRVRTPLSFATGLLGRRLHELMIANPAISIDVNVTSDTQDLIRNRIDVAIALSEEPQSKLPHFRLGSCGLALCASRRPENARRFEST
jgi:DNA-binding transcriptional LysR family regulator